MKQILKLTHFNDPILKTRAGSYPVLMLTVLAVILLISGCGLTGEKSASTTTDGTPVPTPTRDPSGYQTVPAQACMVADWATMQSNRPQGSLISFRPNSTDVTYLTPTDRSSWYVGALMLAKGPTYKEHISLAPTVLAAGNLVWSPSGEKLAFLAYRTSENVYTVMTVQPDGKGLTDLFPADLAKTDARTSPKSILKWKDESMLEVMASCGEECRQSYDIRVDSAVSLALVPTQVADYQNLLDSLQLHPNFEEYKPEQFPKNMPTPVPNKHTTSPNRSPNQDLIAYLDKRGFLWTLSIPDKIMYPLDIGLRDVYETEWSSESSSLAVRAEDRIFIFEIPCRQNK